MEKDRRRDHRNAGGEVQEKAKSFALSKKMTLSDLLNDFCEWQFLSHLATGKLLTERDSFFLPHYQIVWKNITNITFPY